MLQEKKDPTSDPIGGVREKFAIRGVGLKVAPSLGSGLTKMIN